jgi:hypothetical protein
MIRKGTCLSISLCALIVSAPLFGQGPGSCGFHLDLRANETSTHSAGGDAPGGPGGVVPLPAGFPGNPYNAYITPGSPCQLIISGNSLAFGPGPLGPGSCLTLFWAPGSAFIPIAVGPPIIGTCGGGPLMVGVLPGLMTIFDSCGFSGPPAPFGFFDSGSGRFLFNGTIPPFAPPVFTLQAAGATPGGAIWVTNGITVSFGPNPNEVPVAPPVACGGFVPLDEGQSLGQPVPPGFAFYGVAVPGVDVDMNGFVDFVPGAATGGACDFSGASADLACPAPGPQARARVDVNHFDINMAVVPAAPFVPAVTMEMRPPTPGSPDAIIYRWKNAPPFGGAAGLAGLSTSAFCIELQGSAWAGPANRIVIHRSYNVTQDQVGISPGIAADGFGGPPPAAPTCSLGVAGLAFMTTFAPPGGLPFIGGPFGVIHMDSTAAAFSPALLNSAVVFTPNPGPGYDLTVF